MIIKELDAFDLVELTAKVEGIFRFGCCDISIGREGDFTISHDYICGNAKSRSECELLKMLVRWSDEGWLRDYQPN